MGKEEEQADRLAQLIGAWDDVVTLPPAELRLRFKQVVEHDDKTLLQALYGCVAHDFRLIPSTPVWLVGSLNDFELAVVYDRLVLFKSHVLGVPYTHVWTVSADSAHVKPWSKWVLVTGFTLVTPEKSYRIQTSPQSGTHLRRIGAKSEAVGVGEVAGAALALVTGTPDVSGGLREGKESLSDRKVAIAHVQLWQALVDRLSRGQRAPFDSRDTAEELLQAARDSANASASR